MPRMSRTLLAKRRNQSRIPILEVGGFGRRDGERNGEREGGSNGDEGVVKGRLKGDERVLKRW